MNRTSKDSLKAEAVKLYRSGKSAREVARALSISHQTVLNFNREAGTEIRAPHVNNSTTDDARE